MGKDLRKIEYQSSCECYFKIIDEFGNLHNPNGPAIEYSNGDKEWWIDGERHRTDGPAKDWKNYKEWWINGYLHRENGPAVEWKNYKEWWINGERLSPEKEKVLNQWWDNKNGI